MYQPVIADVGRGAHLRRGDCPHDDGDEEVFLPARTSAPLSFVATEKGSSSSLSWSDWRCVLSTASTLALVLFGGAIFPIPFAFNLTGVALGFFTVVFVAAMNDYTSTLLIRTARRCHAEGLKASDGTTLSFEELAKLAGGDTWLALARVALVALLFGTNCGGLAVIAEAAGRTACGLGIVTGGGGGGGGVQTTPPSLSLIHI